MGQHLLGLVLIVFGIMIDSMHCMYTITTATTTTTTTTEMDPFDDRVNLWPNGRVPYVISEKFDRIHERKSMRPSKSFTKKLALISSLD